MKKFFKKTLVALMAIYIVLPFFGFVKNHNVFAATNSYVDTEDLSSYRKTYISSDNTGYDSKAEANLPFDALTKLSVQTKTPDSLKVHTDTDKNVPVITINNATDFSIILSSKKVSVGEDLGNGNKLSSDNYGNTQTGNQVPNISGTGSEKLFVGQIGTGALIVQKSYDGKTYKQAQLKKFNNGYYATNYLNSFGGQNREIFTPDGSDLKKGIFISVSFYYEAYKYGYIKTERYYEWWQYATLGLGMIGGPQGKRDIYGDVYKNIRESYTFFVIEDSVDAVTFNNLTTRNSSEIVEVTKPNSENANEYKVQAEQYNNYLSSVIDRVTQTMHDGDMTTSGFYINVTNVPDNQYVKIKVKRNGLDFNLPSLKTLQDGTKQKVYEISQSGKYDITLSSYSKEKTITLYVDRATANEAYQRYFGKKVIYNGQVYGDTFLNYSPNNVYGNTRVFDAYSNVPVFLSPLTLNLKEQADPNALPLHGVITNKSTGQVSTINSKQITLNSYGEYEVMFSTNKNYYNYEILGNSDIEMSGDVRIYKFNFKLIGKKDDTTVNKQLLSTNTFNDLSISSPSDYAPMFYGVTRTSANKGKIIVAFADKESALRYAKNVAWSEIETGPGNGEKYWLVPNIDNPWGSKVESYSGWKNAQIVKEVAEKMVEKLYFDLTKSATYLTLEKSIEDFDKQGVKVSNLLNDLQLIPLEKSVIVWYSAEQRNAAMAANTSIGKNNVIKFVGKQSYALLTKGENASYSETINGERDYYFIKDILGIDSNTLTAEDAKGKRFSLNYEDGLYAQLKEQNCNPGLVLITETNIYGSSTQYYIYYIPEGYQPATLSLSSNGQIIQISQNKAFNTTSFDKLTLNSVSDIVDPYTYIRIKNEQSNNPIAYYSISDAIGMEFTETGNYEISIIDRFGNSLSYKFSIN